MNGHRLGRLVWSGVHGGRKGYAGAQVPWGHSWAHGARRSHTQKSDEHSEIGLALRKALGSTNRRGGFPRAVDCLPCPAGAELSLTVSDLLHTYLRPAHPANIPRMLLLFIGLGVGTLALRLAINGAKDKWAHLLSMSLAFAFLRWVLLPIEDDRFFVVVYLLVLTALVRSGLDWLQTTSGTSISNLTDQGSF